MSLHLVDFKKIPFSEYNQLKGKLSVTLKSISIKRQKSLAQNRLPIDYQISAA